MQTNSAILNRSATRHFTDQKISEEDLIEIIKIAQKAPSWVNAQTEHVYAVMGAKLEAMRAEHGQLNQRNIPGNSDIPFTPVDQWPSQAKENMNQWFETVNKALGDNWPDKMAVEENRLYNAQAVVYLTLPHECSKWALYDLGSFAEALMTAAFDKGISSMPAYQFIKYPNHLRKNLGITTDDDVIIAIGLGYRDEQAEVNKIKTTRLPIEKFLTIEK
ncbi:nitroreductase family protein [Oenococcus alcoholitolerans]|uniref:nitroreductase family protein n=1 Tax=Oenococcus alcoholitolerans TaxID=931074 RepID=UPI003F70CA64